jgi:hypothetical protein
VNQITIAPGWAAALNPQSTDDAWKIAQALAKSDFVPKQFRDRPHDILIVAAMGARLGLDVFSALQSIAVINGKPTLYGDAMLAVCQSRPDWRGQLVKWDGTGDDERVTVTVRRNMAGGEIDTHEGRFSIKEAKQANLWGKQGPWQQFPRRMMEMRARAYALRGAFADALMGFHAREEMEDVTSPTDVTASATVRTESRLFSEDAAPTQDAAPVEDKSPGKQALDSATAQADQITAEAKQPTAGECIAVAKDLPDQVVQDILESYDAQSFSSVAPERMGAVLQALTDAKAKAARS